MALATTHLFENLTNGTQYLFQVRARNQHGYGVAAEIQATPTERITALPEAPQELRVSTNDASRVKLRWVLPSNAADWHPPGTNLDEGFSEIAGYWVQVCTASCADPGAAWTDLTQNTASRARSYVDEGLTQSLRGRSYRVRAVNINGKSGPWSNVATLQPVRVTDLYPRAHPDHQTVEVQFRVAHPDGAPVYLRLRKSGGDRAATDAKAVTLNRAASVDDEMAVWFHGLEADTGYEVQLDFVDTFDSALRQTAWVRTLPEGQPDPYQVPQPPQGAQLVEVDRSSLEVGFGETESYRIRLAAGACARYSWEYRMVQMHQVDSDQGRFQADPLENLDGEAGGFVLLECGSGTSEDLAPGVEPAPGPWHTINVEARALHRYPVGHLGTKQAEAVLSPATERIAHSVFHVNVGSMQDFIEECHEDQSCGATGWGNGHWQVGAARQAPLTIQVQPGHPAEKAPDDARLVT